MKTLLLYGRILLAIGALAAGVSTTRAQKPDADYYPFKVGDTWTYIGKIGDKSITQIATVKSVETVGGASRATTEWTINGRVVQTEVVAISPQGLSRIEGGQGGKMTPPLPFLKYPAKAGQKWTWKGTIAARGHAIPGDAVVSVSGPVSVKTKAGAFSAMRFHLVLTVSANGSKLIIPSDAWYARGVGLVQQDSQIGALSVRVTLVSCKLK